MNPLRLYLLASILFFFAVNYGAKGIRIDPTKFPEEKRAEVAAAIADKRGEIEAELKQGQPHPGATAKSAESVGLSDEANVFCDDNTNARRNSVTFSSARRIADG